MRALYKNRQPVQGLFHFIAVRELGSNPYFFEMACREGTLWLISSIPTTLSNWE
jgi:hypothetical protein